MSRSRDASRPRRAPCAVLRTSLRGPPSGAPRAPAASGRLRARARPPHALARARRAARACAVPAQAACHDPPAIANAADLSACAGAPHGAACNITCDAGYAKLRDPICEGGAGAAARRAPRHISGLRIIGGFGRADSMSSFAFAFAVLLLFSFVPHCVCFSFLLCFATLLYAYPTLVAITSRTLFYAAIRSVRMAIVLHVLIYVRTAVLVAFCIAIISLSLSRLSLSVNKSIVKQLNNQHNSINRPTTKPLSMQSHMSVVVGITRMLIVALAFAIPLWCSCWLSLPMLSLLSLVSSLSPSLLWFSIPLIFILVIVILIFVHALSPLLFF